MPIPTLDQFQNATKHKSKSGFKSRGRIQHIDHALMAWNNVAHGTDDEMKLAAAYQLVKECKKWLLLKQKEIDSGKAKVSTNLRMTQVDNLVNEATACLYALVDDLGLGHAFDRFEHRKNYDTPGQHRPFRSLHGVYQHERALYVGSRKQRAPSASLLHQSQDAFPKFQKKLGARSFEGLTRRQYEKLDQLTQRKKDVLYFNKIQRLKYMAFPIDGLLCDVRDAPITTKHAYGEPYAMDRYGNLFLTESTAMIPGQLNHSSFNAGREVICAGIIIIEDGLLKMINNSSGHYKPDQLDLHEMLNVLAEEGVDLAAAVVEVIVNVERGVKNYAWIDNPADWETLSGVEVKVYRRTREFRAVDLLADPDSQEWVYTS